MKSLPGKEGASHPPEVPIHNLRDRAEDIF